MDQESIDRYVLNRLQSIDESGIQAISKVVCGDTWGLVYRKKQDILNLLVRCGANVALDETGKKETRQVWTANRMREMRTTPLVFLEVLKAIVDPKRFRFDHQGLAHTIETLNSVLAVDGIAIEIAGSRVQLQPVELSIPIFPEKEVSFEALSAKGILLDKQLEQVVEYRLVDAARCRDSHAFLASIVMMASALETLLIGFTLENLPAQEEPPNVPRYRDGRAKPPEEWKLFDLINISHEMGWIQKDIRDFGQVVRDYRNLVHGYMQYQKKYSLPDAGTCSICWSVSEAVIEDLKTARSALLVDA